ncbi:MAG TPA: extracellular solute-binding protein, partial [Hyphomicrobiaceae bacterium]|nr:extracellular solute-binding protein [Hyphomicrobiaceae bacterium]
PSTSYGLVAEWVEVQKDFSAAKFRLRPEAAFHDGRPITPDDVVFTFEALTRNDPKYIDYYKDVAKVEASGEREVTFHFAVKGNRELAHIVGDMPILPRHYWEAKGADGTRRDIAKATLEPPLGSGPYRIKSLEAGRHIVYERVKDWFAAKLPVMRGQWNIDEIKFIYFDDRQVAFNDFKAGNLDYWREPSAKGWATGYDFDAVKRGHVKRSEVKLASLHPMQGFAFNLRRPQFQDWRVRRAFDLCFDFDGLNKKIMFSAYKRVESFFEGSELKATGIPEGREKAILEEIRPLVPADIFTTPYRTPHHTSLTEARANMREAQRLLAEAGWRIDPASTGKPVLKKASGEVLTAEFLIVSRDFERLILPYIKELESLGIHASVRIVDSSQYIKRRSSFDFDIVVASFGQSISPGNEQREFWGSAAADREGTRNIIGIKDAGIDALIEKVIFAKDRVELVAATRALDRLLMRGHYLVPQWYGPVERIAHWDMLGRPETLPARSVAFPRVWWVDPDAQKRLAVARGR